MALSMDEQRVLAEIERRLAAEEPRLAVCMTSFRRPGPAAALRSPRARIIGSLFTVLLVAMISLMVYAMIPFRAHNTRTPAGQPGRIPSQTQLSATGQGSPGTVSASTGTGSHQASATNGGATNGSATNGSGSNASARNASASTGSTTTNGTGSQGKSSAPSKPAQTPTQAAKAKT
jgi:hypothetical protein